jgi:hypothetical protein
LQAEGSSHSLLKYVPQSDLKYPINDFIQGFFALCLYTILPNLYYYIGVICIILYVVCCIASVYLAVQAIAGPRITVYEIPWKWLISTLLGSGAALDVVIAASMLSYLLEKWRRLHQRSKWFLGHSKLS